MDNRLLSNRSGTIDDSKERDCHILFLSAHANEFRLGDLHRLGDAVAADRFDVIRDDAANIQDGFPVGPGAVDRNISF
jgi:hypothetical protein